MALSRNNHYIPQMYLRNWESSKGKIFVYRLLVSNDNVPLWKEQAIEHTASIKNLYCRVLDNNELDDFELDFGARFETPARVPLEKLINGEKLTAEEWQPVIDFIVAQFVRIPKFQQWMCKLLSKNQTAVFDNLCNESFEAAINGKTFDSSGKPESILPIKCEVSDSKNGNGKYEIIFRTVIGKNYWLQEIKTALSDNSKMRWLFKELKWSVATAYSGMSWPTCDCPVVTCALTQNKQFVKAEDFMIGNNAVVFPISPEKALIGYRKRIFPWEIDLSQQETESIRRLITQNAFMYVFSNAKDETIPNYYKRSVDEVGYKRIQKEYDRWYDDYKEKEGPLLTSKPNINYTS